MTDADTATMHQTADSPQLDPVTDVARTDLSQTTPEAYGGAEVASENAVREVMGDRAFIARPGQITGPGDYVDRFPYWPARFSLGGRVVVPDAPGHPFQHIDARDFADWIVTAGEHQISGAFDAVSPTVDFSDVLREIADLVAPPDTELFPVTPGNLTAGASTRGLGRDRCLAGCRNRTTAWFRTTAPGRTTPVW